MLQKQKLGAEPLLQNTKKREGGLVLTHSVTVSQHLNSGYIADNLSTRLFFSSRLHFSLSVLKILLIKLLA